LKEVAQVALKADKTESVDAFQNEIPERAL
jgi:hypothetical protein